MNYKTIWTILRQTFSNWNEHEAPRQGAALAFYTILSLAPLVILVTAMLALIFGHSTAETELLSQVEGLVGYQGSDAVKAVIEQAQKPSSGALASVFGLLTLLFGASGVFIELRSALDTIWDVRSADDRGIWAMVQERFASFGMVLTVGFLLLVSLLISAALAALGKFYDRFLPIPEHVLSAINIVVSMVSIAALFALIFKYVPRATIPWRECYIGATITSVLFTIGKFAIGLYLGTATIGSAYGAAGSLVVVIIWVYYSAMIFLFGAEFTHILGAGTRPSAPKDLA